MRCKGLDGMNASAAVRMGAVMIFMDGGGGWVTAPSRCSPQGVKNKNPLRLAPEGAKWWIAQFPLGAVLTDTNTTKPATTMAWREEEESFEPSVSMTCVWSLIR